MRHLSLALLRYLLSLNLCLFFLAAATPALATPPPNDNKANATVIAGLPFTDTVDTSEATGEPGEDTGCGGVNFVPRTIWYTFTPATAVRIVASSTFFFRLSGGSLSVCDAQVGSPCGAFQPVIVADLMSGVTYFFQIDGSFPSPVVNFSLAPAPPSPANDDFDQATVIGGLPFTDTVTTLSATVAADDPPDCEFAQNATVWYRFTPPVDTVVLADAFGSDYPTTAAIFTGSRGALTTVGCSSCAVTATLTGGLTYYFMIQAADPVFPSNVGGTLRFRLDGGQPPPGAVKVFGQPDFFSRFPRLSASGLNLPTGVAVDTSGEHLYVADRGNNRILEYDNPLTADAFADRVFGQPDFLTGTTNTGGISASSLNTPTEIAVDAQGNLYVADSFNNRVLRYDNPLSTDAMADLVIGQPNSTTGTANTGGLSASSLSFPAGVAVDAGGNLYVGEFSNNRVLRFDSPLVNSDAAELVLGQPDFSTATSNTGGLSASSLSVATDVTLDVAGNLYVSDTGNARVLKFGAPLAGNDAAADLVIGKPDFTTPFNQDECRGPGVSASTLCDPRGLAVGEACGNLYVADFPNNRVLVYLDPLTTDTIADSVLGQINFEMSAGNAFGISANSLLNPRGVAVDAAGNLYVADTGNSRVLLFEGDPDFDGVKSSQDSCLCVAPALGLDADHNGCTDTLGGLKAIVQGLTLDAKIKNGLLGKLGEAQKALDRGNKMVAVSKLRDFISQVEGQRGKALSNSVADLLVNYANNLIVLIST